jgi:ABC-type branched-subunit amino acid transport system substrate-binding protein
VTDVRISNGEARGSGPTSPAKGRTAWVGAALVALVCLLATFTLSTSSEGTDDASRLRQKLTDTDPGALTDPLATVDAANPATPGGTTPGQIPGVQPRGGPDQSLQNGGRYDCSKGQNAGATAIGVTPTEIRFAATVVTTGIAKGFLADAQQAMEAVRNKVNRAGGICGRKLTIDYKDDGWDSATGQRYIESFIGDKKYFGLAVNPSSEGLRGAIDSGVIRSNKFPVIGSDGQLIDQYTDPWVWPVATSTASVMHVMAANASSRGAKTFGIVWDKNYRFGVEGHAAFVGAVKRLGGVVNSDQGVDGNQGDFANTAKTFMDDCGGTSFSKCDFVATLLEPAPASSWVLRDGGLGDGKTHPRVGVGVPQPLFVNSFARDCKGYCANMWAWTSFNPPIPPFDDAPAVATYRTDLANQSSVADASNPHVQGAYVGMMLLVKVLQILGPAPTREGARQVLDSMNGANAFESGMAPPISFKPGNHYGNVGAQAFEDIVSGKDSNATFANWRYTNSGFISDGEVGKDVVGG